MATYPVIQLIDNQPTFEKPLQEILAELKEGGALKLLSPTEYHTDSQRRWYKGICLQGLSDWNGETKGEWDLRLKALCNGNELLKKESILFADGNLCTRLTIVGVGKKNFTQFIENILSLAIEQDWPVTAPDPELRSSFLPEQRAGKVSV
jgi:hypothetical protein